MKESPFDPFEEKLRADRAPGLLVDTFRRQFESFASGQSGLIPQSDLIDMGDLRALEGISGDGNPYLGKTLMLKLNGGLGTSMGLEKAKSLLRIKNGMSFLDILAKQTLHLRRAHRVDLPLVLMNSFNTESDSRAALACHAGLATQPIPQSFLQHRVPRILAADSRPVAWPDDPDKEWCPPGHGDLYIAIQTSGLLAKMLDAGFEYAFVSNADNLGATLDSRILGYFASRGLPFMMEVTDRTPADSKGGHLARHKNGGLLLREIAQCPANEQADFQDVGRHRFFNTNNLWLNLRALAAKPRIDLPIIINRKTVDPRDAKSPGIIQLETAMGSAIAVFPGAEALRVPRARFSPVKTTDDLLALWSDAYDVTDEWYIRLNAKRASPPVIKLDPAYYRRMDDFEARFPNGAPSLLECTSLTVEGDFRFGKNVKVKGHAVLRNESGAAQIISDETQICNRM